MALRSPSANQSDDAYSLSSMTDDRASKGAPEAGMEPEGDEAGLASLPDEQTIGMPDPNAGVAVVVESTRQMEQTLDDMMGSFPEAANEIRRAQSAVRGVLQRVVQIAGGAQQGPNPMLG